VLRFDSVGGASGDMILSALAAVGADIAAIGNSLRGSLPEPVEIDSAQVSDRGICGVRVRVRTARAHDGHNWIDAKPGHGRHEHGHDARTLADVARILDRANMPPRARDLSMAVFRRLADAEGRVHGVPPEKVHFHEVGAVDAIVDIAGSCLALDRLGVDGVDVGPLPCGAGTIHCAHGVMPNPAPATLLLLEGMAVTQTDETAELVTPTGAAILATWVRELPAPTRALRVRASGFGFGQRALTGRPNVLRATLLDPLPAGPDAPADGPPDTATVIEANLDDCNPQWLADLVAALLSDGALDAWLTPVTMKKGRPGVVLSVLTTPDRTAEMEARIFAGSTTFGVRRHTVARTCLSRRWTDVPTPYGAVSVKIGSIDGRDIVRTPEFESCARLAREAGVTVRQVSEAAAAALDRGEPGGVVRSPP
jgi:uncharacterized protein (TIGR00299 family) protein